MQRAVKTARQSDRVRRGRNSEHTGRDTSAGIHALEDHQIRTRPLTLLDHGRGDMLRGHVSEHGHTEVLTVQIGMAPPASWIAQSSSRLAG